MIEPIASLDAPASTFWAATEGDGLNVEFLLFFDELSYWTTF
jgi:hypothetical protein